MGATCGRHGCDAEPARAALARRGRFETRGLPRAAVAGQHLCRSYALGAFRMGGLCLPRAAGRRPLVLAVVRHGTRRCGALVGGQCLHGRCFVQAVRHSDGRGTGAQGRCHAAPPALCLPRRGRCLSYSGAAEPRGAGTGAQGPQEPEYGPRARRTHAAPRHHGDDSFPEKVAHQFHVPQIRRGGHAARRRFLDGLPADGRGAVPRRGGAPRPARRVAARR